MDPVRVVGLLYQRQAHEAAWRAAAERVLECYEGRIRLPEPEIDEVEGSLVANLIVSGIDQTGMRIASAPPQTRFFPERPGQHASEQRAYTRGAALKGLRADNATNLLRRKRARWFVAFAKAPVLIRPLDGRVTWEPRDPFSTYPAPSADPDAMMSENCVFSVQRPYWWVAQKFPGQASMLRRPKNMSSSEMVTLVEYIDSDVWGMYAAAPDVGSHDRIIERNFGHAYGATPGITHSGPEVLGGPRQEWLGSEDAVTLVEDDNRAGLCPVVVPQRITLGGLQGQFDQMVGLYIEQARLAALHYIGIRESVFPPLYAVEREDGQGQLEVIPADPKRGKLGEIRGGTLLPVPLNPGFQVFPAEDRLERAQRLNGGIPSDYGGESGTNIRTARRGEQILGGVIDFPIQEAHEVFERSEWHENQCAIAVGKGWCGNKQFFFGPTHRGRGKATWSFNELFPTDESTAHEVKYPYAGADANGQLIRTMQKMDTLISRQTAREDDPEIDDPELEKDRIDIEALEAALRGGIQQQIGGGTMDPAVAARMIELIASDRMDLVAAYRTANEEAKALQAAQVPAGSPELQPGAASPLAAITAQAQGAEPSPVSQMTSALGALRLGQMATPQEQRAEVAAVVGGA